MSVICDYFLAPNDERAAQVMDWPAGPAHPPRTGLFRKSGPDALPTVELTNIEPTVQMGTLEELLTGRPYEDIVSDSPDRDVAFRDGGELMVIRVTKGLQDALAASSDDRLREVATPWSETEEFWGQGDARALGRVLAKLAALARAGLAENQSLYCWICV